jgi:hypothetical protein
METVKTFKYLLSLFTNQNFFMRKHVNLKQEIPVFNQSKRFNIYKTVILPVVLQSCKTYSLIWQAFKNRILRRIFGPKKDENWEWRRLKNEELLNL